MCIGFWSVVHIARQFADITPAVLHENMLVVNVTNLFQAVLAIKPSNFVERDGVFEMARHRGMIASGVRDAYTNVERVTREKEQRLKVKAPKIGIKKSHWLNGAGLCVFVSWLTTNQSDHLAPLFSWFDHIDPPERRQFDELLQPLHLALLTRSATSSLSDTGLMTFIRQKPEIVFRKCVNRALSAYPSLRDSPTHAVDKVSGYIPDFMFEHQKIIIEINEHDHRDYDKEDEKVRIAELSKDWGFVHITPEYIDLDCAADECVKRIASLPANPMLVQAQAVAVELNRIIPHLPYTKQISYD